MDIRLEQITDETFPKYFSVYLEENGKDSAFDSELRERIARFSIDPSHSIVRGIWQKDTGEILGYCEARNLDDPEWEIGIYILEQHRFKGVGKAALPLFLDELASFGKHSFVAKILTDNCASRALVEGLGAVFTGTETLGGLVEDGALEQELIRLRDDAASEERTRLEAIQEIILGMPSDVCVYRIEWPLKTS